MAILNWDFNIFVQDRSNYFSNLLTLRGYLTTIVIILAGFYCWKNLTSWWWSRIRLIKFASTLPGPPTLPIIGNAFQFICKTEDTLDRIVDISSPYSSLFRVWLGPKLFIVTTNPRDYEIILGSKKAAYKDTTYRVMEPIIGQGLVSGSGSKHKAHRKLIIPMLSNKSLSIYFQYFNRHSQICTDLLEREVDNGEFDVSSYMARCTVDIVLDTIMGCPGVSQNGDRYKDLIYWTERMYEILHTRMVKVWLYYDTFFFLTKLGNDHNKGVSVVHNFTESIIAQKKEERKTIDEGKMAVERPRVMLLEQLIDHVTENNDMNDIELRDEIYTIFTAAQDTTAVISSFVLLMLAMHPAIQDEVREELNLVLKKENLNEKNLQKLKYLEMVIRETLRLFPIAPLMVRQLKGDIELESCTLPEGCSVVMIPFLTHRDPRYWHEPEKFIPERFLPEQSEGRHHFANVPFSGGHRGCIGQKFAIMCLKTIVANIIRRYKLSSTEKLENLRLKTDISIRSRNGYKLSLTKVDEKNVDRN